jgi:PTS system glucose-specific IIA component
MKLFEKKTTLFCPVKGYVKNINEVKDDVFAQQLLGNGFAVEPHSNSIYVPVKGKVVSVFPTKHAISIQGKGNLDVLIHVGLETVELNGTGFQVKVQAGDRVDSDTELMSVDFDYIKESGRETDVIVVFPEAKDKELSVKVGLSEEKQELGFLK